MMTLAHTFLRAPEGAAAAQAIVPADVFRMHAADVGRWAKRLGGPTIDADDVVQEVFVKAFKHLPRFRGESVLSTWLFRITANEVRRRRRREPLGTRTDSPEEAAQVPAHGPGPDEDLERRQEIAKLYRALDGLKDKHRESLVLFEIEGLSGEQISELMDAPVSTVWVWLHRARGQLLARLEALEGKEAAS